LCVPWEQWYALNAYLTYIHLYSYIYIYTLVYKHCTRVYEIYIPNNIIAVVVAVVSKHAIFHPLVCGSVSMDRRRIYIIIYGRWYQYSMYIIRVLYYIIIYEHHDSREEVSAAAVVLPTHTHTKFRGYLNYGRFFWNTGATQIYMSKRVISYLIYALHPWPVRCVEQSIPISHTY